MSSFTDVVDFYANLESRFHSGEISDAQMCQELQICLTKLYHFDFSVCGTAETVSFWTSLLDLPEQIRGQIRNQIHELQHLSLARNDPTENTPTNACGETALINPPIKRKKVVLSGREEEENERLLAVVNDSVVVPTVRGFHEVAGLESVKAVLDRAVILPIRQPQLYPDIKGANCILLFGPPGTGKTNIVHALAAEAQATLHCVGASTILCSYIGQSEKTLRAIFQQMKCSEILRILFIDEIDGLCRHRTGGEVDFTRRLKTELMCQMTDFANCRNAFLICATNCPWDLDVAFLRRFQERVYVPLPSSAERFRFLELYTKGTSLESTRGDWERIIERTEGFSGSDMADFVQHALRMPITQLQDTRIWREVDNGYEPFVSFNPSNKYVLCNLKDLPPRTAKARAANSLDLMRALDRVTRTVSNADVEKYEDYIRKR